MGTHGNGDNGPADGDRWPEEPAELRELPALPHDVTIPDDLAAIADEAEQIRAELDHERRHPPPSRPPAAADSEPTLAVPFSIMSVAVVITLVSLFAMAWSGANVADQAEEHTRPLPSVVLTDATGQATDVTAATPVAIMLVESCDCAGLIADTVAAAPPEVTVIAIGRTAPAHPPGVAGGADLRLLADPDGEVRNVLGLGRPHDDTATVVLIDRDQTITHTAPAATSTDSYYDHLATLGTG